MLQAENHGEHAHCQSCSWLELHEWRLGSVGRTGRAGCTGVSVVLVDRKKEGLIGRIEQRAGMKFERIGAPQPADMARVAGERAVQAIKVRPCLVDAHRPCSPSSFVHFDVDEVERVCFEAKYVSITNAPVQ